MIRGKWIFLAAAVLVLAIVSLIDGSAALAQPVQSVSQKTATVEEPASAASVVPTESVTMGKGDTISLDFKDAEIETVLRVLSMKSGVNIVTGPEVKGAVTVRLDNVPWEKAMDVILKTYDFVYERDGNIIRVTTRDKMTQEPVETKTFVLNYCKAAEIQTAVQDILTERGRIKVAERTNMVVVTDIPSNLYKIGGVIEKLDKITPQAFIDSKVIKTGAGLTEQLGIDWSTGTTNNLGSLTGSARPTTFPFNQTSEAPTPFINQFFPVIAGGDKDLVVNSADARGFPYISKFDTTTKPILTYGTLDFSKFAAILKMLVTNTDAKVVSNPRIVVLNNQTAKVQVGTDVPVPSFERNETTGSMEVSGYDYRSTGVVLNVTPHINSADEILVDLKPEVSSKGADVSFQADFKAPSFIVTKAETQVLIKSGQTIAVGGLMTDNFSSTDNKVPYLGDIPVVGKLFRSKRQSTDSGVNEKVETLFFVTVTMVDTEGQPAVDKDSKQSSAQGAQGAASAVDKNVAGSAKASKSGTPANAAASPKTT